MRALSLLLLLPAIRGRRPSRIPAALSGGAGSSTCGRHSAAPGRGREARAGSSSKPSECVGYEQETVKALMTGGSEPLLAIPSEVLLPDIGFQRKDQQSKQWKGGLQQKV